MSNRNLTLFLLVLALSFPLAPNSSLATPALSRDELNQITAEVQKRATNYGDEKEEILQAYAKEYTKNYGTTWIDTRTLFREIPGLTPELERLLKDQIRRAEMLMWDYQRGSFGGFAATVGVATNPLACVALGLAAVAAMCKPSALPFGTQGLTHEELLSDATEILAPLAELTNGANLTSTMRQALELLGLSALYNASHSNGEKIVSINSAGSNQPNAPGPVVPGPGGTGKGPIIFWIAMGIALVSGIVLSIRDYKHSGFDR